MHLPKISYFAFLVFNCLLFFCLFLLKKCFICEFYLWIDLHFVNLNLKKLPLNEDPVFLALLICEASIFSFNVHVSLIKCSICSLEIPTNSEMLKCIIFQLLSAYLKRGRYGPCLQGSKAWSELLLCLKILENGYGHWGEMDSDITHGLRGAAMV